MGWIRSIPLCISKFLFIHDHVRGVDALTVFVGVAARLATAIGSFPCVYRTSGSLVNLPIRITLFICFSSLSFYDSYDIYDMKYIWIHVRTRIRSWKNLSFLSHLSLNPFQHRIKSTRTFAQCSIKNLSLSCH